jgi:hypothetical protein
MEAIDESRRDLKQSVIILAPFNPFLLLSSRYFEIQSCVLSFCLDVMLYA